MPGPFETSHTYRLEQSALLDEILDDDKISGLRV
jgi:hypothetical protein